uniref:RNA-directed DNA polymerase n=1 Tax=Xenopsylla cheopis TaxID=163159 RepID=A0A6M2DDL8_XENCH
MTDHMAIMRELITSLMSKPKTGIRALPRFNPDLMGADPSGWCAAADAIMDGNPLEGSELYSALSSAMEGSAAQWLTQVIATKASWPRFKQLFVSRFGGKVNAVSTIMKIFSEHAMKDETTGAFGIRLRSILQARLEELPVSEIINAIALFRLSSHDRRVERIALTKDIKTEEQFLEEMETFTFLKRKTVHPEETSTQPYKRHKFAETPAHCNNCGRLGHKSSDCYRRDSTTRRRPDTARRSTSPTRVICYRCKEDGHIATKCPRLYQKEAKLSQERRVDSCRLAPSTGTLRHMGESFIFYFDSGAECSLIKESVASKFSGKRMNKLIIMRGIGNVAVNSTMQILSVVSIDNFKIEIIFHVIADENLQHDIMIGREILNQGFDIKITHDSFTICKTKMINICTKSTVNEIDIKCVNTDVQGEDWNRLVHILEEYKDSFISGFPRTRVITGELKVRLIDPNVIVQRRPYRLSVEERQVVRTKISELIEAKIIRPSHSPFASPILLVKKKDGTDRLCVDYRELNKNMVADRYPLPLISDQIARLQNAKFFVSLDMASGFHQIPIHPDSIEYTAFVTPDGQYEYMTMPFGLKNAPSVFQRAILKALGDLAYSFAVVYLDDVLIIANSIDEAFKRIRIVLNVLIKAGFSFNFSKCSFLKTSVLYLGYEIKNGEVRPNPGKIRALTSLPPPSTVVQLRQFIGLASYFRKFIPKFSQILKPLYTLTSCKSVFNWTCKCENIRQTIINTLTNEPVLMIFNPSFPIELHTDASSEGYGAVLMQKVNHENRVVEYFSKRTSSAESRYHSYELETLAVVNSVKHFRHYLHGREFLVVTDCNSLKASRNKINLNDRVHRWWAYLQAFSFDIMYR